ncbi:hypothetical protein [Streptomyces sp. NPDC005752]
MNEGMNRTPVPRDFFDRTVLDAAPEIRGMSGRPAHRHGRFTNGMPSGAA